VCLVYLDYIILFSKTVEEHLVRLKQVLDRLRWANLKLKPSKCCLMRSEVSFLGHLVSKDGIATDPEKISMVKDWPRPANLTELRSCIGLCSYYRMFGEGFAPMTDPLPNRTANAPP